MPTLNLRLARNSEISSSVTGCCKGCFYIIVAFFLVNTLLFFLSQLLGD